MKVNPNIQSSFLRAQALAHRIKPTGTLDDPFIAVGKDQIPIDGSMGSVTRYQISQTIPFPGKLGAKSDVAESRANSALSDAETTKREIFVFATQAFYRAYFNQQAIDSNEKVQKIIESTVESTKARYKTGDSGHHEWLLAKIELNVIEIEKLKLFREKEFLLAILNELRNKPADSTLGKLEVKFSSDDFIEESSRQDQPELKSLNFQLTLADKEERFARLSYFPDFVIQGMAMYPGPEMMEEKSNWGVMIGINIPLFFWRKQTEIVAAAVKDREATVLELKNLENRLNSEVVDAKLQFKTARDVLSLYRDSIIPTTNLAVQDAKSGYVSKRLLISQFLETLKVQKTQELEYLASQIDVELAKTRLQNLLSSPPVLRLAPLRPSLFGGGTMGNSMPSDTVNMGKGMSGPSRKIKTPESNQNGSGMGNM
jgi:cobalt-zinc-cadmium efflux system outer membrane protein